MTDTSKEAVDLLAMVLRQRAPNNSGFDQERAASVMCALRDELDEAKAEIERLRKTLRACDGIFRMLGYASNSVARGDISSALKGSSQ